MCGTDQLMNMSQYSSSSSLTSFQTSLRQFSVVLAASTHSPEYRSGEGPSSMVRGGMTLYIVVKVELNRKHTRVVIVR